MAYNVPPRKRIPWPWICQKGPRPDAVLSPGAATVTKAKGLNLCHLPLEEDFSKLTLPWQQQIEQAYSTKAWHEAWETAKHLSQNNPTSVRPHKWLHSDQQSGYCLHEVVGLEGIIHLRDLTLQMENSLHITELIKPFLPPPINLKLIRIQCWSSMKDIIT